MAIEIGCALLGALLLGLVQFDIVATVLHPEIESPLSNRFHRLIWGSLRFVERLAPNQARCHAILNWGLPLMVAGMIALWLLLLLVGFALIYYPWIGSPASFETPDGLGRSLIEAFYFSGVTLFTIGYGDIQPIALPFRLLVVAEAASGVVAVALSVAYVLEVYPALSRKRTVAVALDAEVAGQADALPMVRRYLLEKQQLHGELAGRLRDLGLELLVLTESHETHPVLYYAHPQRVQHSFLRILVTLQHLVGLLRYGLSPDRYAEVVRSPQLLVLEQSLHYSLRRLSASIHSPTVDGADDGAERQRLTADYNRLCDELERLGLVSARSVATVPVAAMVEAAANGSGDEEPTGSRPRLAEGLLAQFEGPQLLDPALDLSAAAPVDGYTVFRLETDTHIAAYAAACGYSIEQATRDYPLSWWADGR